MLHTLVMTLATIATNATIVVAFSLNQLGRRTDTDWVVTL
jgi:hypothetical protein